MIAFLFFYSTPNEKLLGRLVKEKVGSHLFGYLVSACINLSID